MQKVNPKLSAACFVIGRLQYEYHISCPPPERRKEIAAQLHRFSAQLTNADRYEWVTPDCPQCASNCSHKQSTNKAETAKPNGSRHSVTDEQLATALGCPLGTQDQQIELDDVVNRVFTTAADELTTLEKEYHEGQSSNSRADEIAAQLMSFKEHMYAADLYEWILKTCYECTETCNHDSGPKAVYAMPRAQRTSMKEKLLELTVKVSNAVYPAADSWNAGLILRDVIAAHTRWEAEVIPYSVLVNDWNLDEHCVVECNGYLCDATAFRISGAPMGLVGKLDGKGCCQIGDVLYHPCVSEDFIGLVAGSERFDSSEAVGAGTISEEELKALLEPTIVAQRG